MKGRKRVRRLGTVIFESDGRIFGEGAVRRSKVSQKQWFSLLEEFPPPGQEAKRSRLSFRI